MKLRYKLLNASLMSASLLALPSMAYGQDSGQNASAPDEVIATGIRQSLQNALIEKREADSLIEVILAEDIGKLPDQNLAEVLENVTGIQITREAGVGTGVQIRGANENRIEINGVTTVGSGTGRGGINFEDVSAAIIAGVEVIKAPESDTIEGAVGGTINLRTIRPLDLDEEILASFRVQAEDSSLSTDGLQPRFEGTVGKKWGNASGQEIGVVLSGSYTQQDTTAFRPRGEADCDNAIAAGVQNLDGNDFICAQFFVQDIDNFEAENINFAGTIEASPWQGVKLFFDAIVNTQERFQESSRVQFSGIANTDSATALALDPNTVFETVDFGSIGGQEIGTIERAVTGVIPVQPDFTDGNLRFSSDTGSRVTDTTIFRVGGEWEVTDALTARAEFSQSDSDTVNPSILTTLNFINPNVPLNLNQLRQNFINAQANIPTIEQNEAIEAQNAINAAANLANGNMALPITPLLPLLPTGSTQNENGTPFLFDVSNGQIAFGISQDPALFGPTTEQLLDPGNLLLDQFNQSFDETDNSETAFRFDVSYDLEDTGLGGFVTSVDAGYRYNDTSSEFSDIGTIFGTGSINGGSSGGAPVASLFSEILVRGPDNFGDADGRDLFVQDFLVIDPELTQTDPQALFDILNNANTLNNQMFGLSAPNFNEAGIDQDTSFEISEETHAFYGQVNFEYGFLRGNAGLRYVNTDVVSTGFQTLNDVTTAVDTEGGYDFLLPRVNLIAEPVENVLIRAAWSEDIRRPDFNDLSTSFTFDSSPNPAVEVGNPALVPQEITNFDVGVEWYFAPSAVFSVGYFRKERDGLFVSSVDAPAETLQEVFDANGNLLGSELVRDITDPCEGGGIFNPIADQNQFAPLDPITGAQVQGTGICVPLQNMINDSGTVTQQGVEVGFQYDLSSWEDKLGWASGFGVLANYTYQVASDSESLLNPSAAGSVILPAASGGATNIQFPFELLDNSRHSYNITAFYEKFGLSARLRWTWRDAFRTEDTAAGASIGSTFGFQTITDARGQLNGSINYDINEHLTVGVDAVNLTRSDITQRCVNEGGPVCFTGFTDRRIIFGGSYRF